MEIATGPSAKIAGDSMRANQPDPPSSPVPPPNSILGPCRLEDADVNATRAPLSTDDDVTLDDGRVHPRVASRRAAVNVAQDGKSLA